MLIILLGICSHREEDICLESQSGYLAMNSTQSFDTFLLWVDFWVDKVWLWVCMNGGVNRRRDFNGIYFFIIVKLILLNFWYGSWLVLIRGLVCIPWNWVTDFIDMWLLVELLKHSFASVVGFLIIEEISEISWYDIALFFTITSFPRLH